MENESGRRDAGEADQLASKEANARRLSLEWPWSQPHDAKSTWNQKGLTGIHHDRTDISCLRVPEVWRSGVTPAIRPRRCLVGVFESGGLSSCTAIALVSVVR